MSGAGDGLSRHTFTGSGSIDCKHPIGRECRIRLTQLVNGCIVVQLSMENVPNNLSKWLRQCQSFDFTGTLDDGRHVMVKNINVVGQQIRSPFADVQVLEGFVRQPGYFDLANPDGAELSFRKVICEVTDFPLHGHTGSVEVDVGQARIQFDPLHDHAETLRLTANLKTAGVLGRITVELKEQGSENQLDELVGVLCGLLSLAQRSHVRYVSQEWNNIRGGIGRTRYQEPIFYYPMMTRPLIPAKSLAGFVQSSLETYERQYATWNLVVAQDHYIQALSLRSAWPQSVGFFTALETLKHAFLRQAGKGDLECYLPKGEFKKKQIASQIKELLRKNFEVFRSLSPDEAGSLSGKIGDLNRRAYKVILRKMFEELNVRVRDDALREIVQLRNQIIHTGAPDYQNDPSEAALQASRVAGLVEKIMLLGILHYEGSFERYDKAFLPPCE